MNRANETIKYQSEESFPELLTLVKALSPQQKRVLKRVLEEEEVSPSDKEIEEAEQLFKRVAAAFGTEWSQPVSEQHFAILEEAKQVEADDNAKAASALWEIQKQAYHLLNAEKEKSENS